MEPVVCVSMAYELALEHVQSIFERLVLRERLPPHCAVCPLMLEVEKLAATRKEARLAGLEEEMGYYLK